MVVVVVAAVMLVGVGKKNVAARDLHRILGWHRDGQRFQSALLLLLYKTREEKRAAERVANMLCAVLPRFVCT